jgi:hypothetical protein
VIIYRKVRDLKGQYPRDRIRHAFDLKNTPPHKGSGDVPVRPDEKDWRHATGWAEVGKTAVIFSLKYDPYGDFGHTYIDGCWYATMCPERDWDFWWAIYADAALLTRWHCGTPAQLAGAVERQPRRPARGPGTDPGAEGRGPDRRLQPRARPRRELAAEGDPRADQGPRPRRPPGPAPGLERPFGRGC